MKLETVVVPWDGSDMSKDALTNAIELADDTAQIEVVHVTPYTSVTDPSVIWETYSEDVVREKITESFKDDVRHLSADDVGFSVRFGDPGRMIATFAEEVNADLIVISSHGRTGLRRMLIGSVAERVVRLAPCPILVLREKPLGEDA